MALATRGVAQELLEEDVSHDRVVLVTRPPRVCVNSSPQKRCLLVFGATKFTTQTLYYY